MRRSLGLLLLFSLLLTSCGSITREEFEKRLSSLESRIAQLEERQKTLEERNIRTEARVDNIAEGLARTRLEIEKLKLDRQAPTHAGRLPEPTRETLQGPPTSERLQEVAKPPQESPQRAAEDYQREYDEAIRLYNLRQLNQAKDRLIEFIKKYPRTPLTDNAYLWLGVVYRDLGELNKAEAVWLTLVERCQKKEMVDCNKAPSALLQLARLYEQRGDNQKAKDYYESILRDYPLSEEASTARAKLGR